MYNVKCRMWRALIFVFLTYMLICLFFYINIMSQIKYQTFKEQLHLQLSQFVYKVTTICESHHVQLESEGPDLYHRIMDCINPLHQEQPYNPQSLTNFLKETLNNQAEKKLKNKYCHKDLTMVSGSTKLFGYFDSFLPNRSSVKESSLSHQSIFSSSLPLSTKDQHIQNSIKKEMFGKDSVESEQERLKEESGSPFRCRNSDENKKLYKLYPSAYKQEIVEYASKFGFKEASQKYKISASKINVWNKSLNKVKQTRGRKPIDPNMEEKVCDWLKRELEKGTALTQKIIREKAKRISCSDDFKASKGWLQKFFRRRPQLFEAYTKNRKSQNEESVKGQQSNEMAIKKEEKLFQDQEDIPKNEQISIIFSSRNHDNEEGDLHQD